MLPIDKLLEQYSIWVVLGAIAIYGLIQIGLYAIRRFIELRSKKVELDLETTSTLERTQALDKAQQLSILQQQYEQLADVARLRQEMVDEKNVEIQYLLPLADRTTRAEESYDLLKSQNEQQAGEISRLNQLVNDLEDKLRECGADIAFSQSLIESETSLAADREDDSVNSNR